MLSEVRAEREKNGRASDFGLEYEIGPSLKDFTFAGSFQWLSSKGNLK